MEVFVDMFAPLLKKLFGSKNEREVKRMLKAVQAVNALEEQMLSLSDEQLRSKTEEFKARLEKGETLDQILPEAFAVCREAGKRVMGRRHFDVQLIGGMVLARHGIPAALGWLARPDGGLRTAVAVLAALAALAALEPVLLRWGVPGWGDSIYWDRLTHLIAMGEMPAGESYYMPLYQYGSAGLLWAFGHFQQVPQLSNVAMAPLTVLFVALAAWELFRDGRLALAAAALAIAAATLGLAHLAWGRHHQVRPIPEKLAIGEVDTALAAAPDLTRTFAATWPTTPSKARIVTAGQPVRLRVELSRQHHIPSTRSLANR